MYDFNEERVYVPNGIELAPNFTILRKIIL